jgi:hypothetical protein
MRKYIKSGPVVIAAVLLMLQAADTQAAKLKHVRSFKHKSFSRIVFEFQHAAQFMEPVIQGKGKFSVVFPDSTTVLPRQILYKKTRIQPVRSIEFIQKGNLLAANIKLSFPYFKLKTFTLSGPDRVVIDAYLTTPPPQEVVPEESLQAKPSVKVSKEPDTKESKAAPETSSTKELSETVSQLPTVITEKPRAEESGEPKMTQPKPIPIQSSAKENGDELKTEKKPVSDLTQAGGKNSSEQSLNNIPAPPITAQGPSDERAKQEPIPSVGLLPSKYNNYNLQIYLLALLNFLTIVIVLLLSVTLLKKKSGVNSVHPGKISESLKTVDENIAAIDAMISRELKKHNES